MVGQSLGEPCGSKKPITIRDLYPTSECGIFAVQGGIANFWAELTNMPNTSKVSYFWQVTGGNAAIVGADDQWSVAIQVPQLAQTETVSVTVTFDDCQLSKSLTFPTLDPELATRLEHFCKLIHYAHVNLFVNPLWDPLRDLVTHPPTGEDIRQMHTISNVLNELTAELFAEFGKPLGQSARAMGAKT